MRRKHWIQTTALWLALAVTIVACVLDGLMAIAVGWRGGSTVDILRWAGPSALFGGATLCIIQEITHNGR